MPLPTEAPPVDWAWGLTLAGLGAIDHAVPLPAGLLAGGAGMRDRPAAFDPQGPQALKVRPLRVRAPARQGRADAFPLPALCAADVDPEA